jgi:hypothetical protein
VVRQGFRRFGLGHIHAAPKTTTLLRDFLQVVDFAGQEACIPVAVPTDFRRNSEIPGILVLHHADLPESDVQAAQAYNLTRPLRAILDLIDAGSVERNFIRQAVNSSPVDRFGTRDSAGLRARLLRALLRKAA